MRLERADGPEQWRLRTRTGLAGVEFERSAAGTADVVVRAGASDLLLLLWRRRGVDEVACDGAEEALLRLLDWPVL